MKRVIAIAMVVGLAAAVAIGSRGPTAQEHSVSGQWQSGTHGPRPTVWSTQQTERPNDRRPPTQPGTRVTYFEQGRPLLEQLTLEDERLEVVDNSFPPFSGGAPDPTRELEAHTRRASAVVVARVTSMWSTPTPEQDWLKSDIEFGIEDILKSPTAGASISVGQTLAFSIDGGRLAVGIQTIIARPRWANIPHEGGRYLLFLHWDGRKYLLPAATKIFEVTENALRRLQIDGAHWGIDQREVNPTFAFDVVRASARLPRID